MCIRSVCISERCCTTHICMTVLSLEWFSIVDKFNLDVCCGVYPVLLLECVSTGVPEWIYKFMKSWGLSLSRRGNWMSWSKAVGGRFSRCVTTITVRDILCLLIQLHFTLCSWQSGFYFLYTNTRLIIILDFMGNVCLFDIWGCSKDPQSERTDCDCDQSPCRHKTGGPTSRGGTFFSI